VRRTSPLSAIFSAALAIASRSNGKRAPRSVATRARGAASATSARDVLEDASIERVERGDAAHARACARRIRVERSTSTEDGPGRSLGRAPTEHEAIAARDDDRRGELDAP